MTLCRIVLQDGLFDGLVHLQRISLRNNRIELVSLKLLTNSSDIRSLQRIDLASNLLTKLEPWPFLRAVVVTDVFVTVADNRINKFRISSIGIQAAKTNDHFTVKLECKC